MTQNLSNSMTHVKSIHEIPFKDSQDTLYHVSRLHVWIVH